MVQGIHIPFDPSGSIHVLEFAGLKALQAGVDGWIEAVDILTLGITMFVNEEGLVRHLPFNARASFLWWFHVPAARQRMLVGDAVIVGYPGTDGEATDVPQELVDLLTAEGEYAIALKARGEHDWSSDPARKIASVVLPLRGGDSNWFVSTARYEDYFSAVVWAMVLLERIDDVIEVKVGPATELR